MGDFNIMWNTRCPPTAFVLLAALQILPIYGQLFTCIPWMQTKSITCTCSDNFRVFIDDAFVKEAAGPNICAPSGDSDCNTNEIITEYVRTVCFNKTSCKIQFHYQDFTCQGFNGPLYFQIHHRCQPVFDVDGMSPLPSAVIGDQGQVDRSGVHVMIHSPQYPDWTPASHIQCRMDIPASTVVRLDVMDLSRNTSSFSNQFTMNLGNSSYQRSFRRGRSPTTLFWNNTRRTNASVNLYFIAMEDLTPEQYAAFFIRFFIFLSAVEFDNTFSSKPIRITCPPDTQLSPDKVASGGNSTTSNPNISSSLPESTRHSVNNNDYNIVAVVVGATVGALLLVVIVSIISVILGTRQRKRRKPTPEPATDQELRYHVHANMMAATKMQAILENRENVSAMQQVQDLNAIIVSSSSIDFGTVDSRAPLERHIIMAPDAAEDSAYDSSTEPVRSLEDLTFASNPRRPYLQSQDNPLFFTPHRDQDGGPKPMRTHSMHARQPRFDRQYQNHEAIEKAQLPRPKSALALTDHEYVNDFLPRRPTKRKGLPPLRRSLSQHNKRSGRHARPKRTHSLYSTRVDHVKSPDKPKDHLYYNTQPQPQMRKNPRRLQTIPSVDLDDDASSNRLSANNKYSFHILGSTQSLSDTVYSYPSSIDRHPGNQDPPKGLLFFSNNSIHAMLQDKRAVPLEDLYAVPQKKKRSGFVKLSGADATNADHDA